MKRFKIAPQSVEVSAVAYGAWRLDQDPAGASVAAVRAKIDACLESGITTFDHAAVYGDYTCEGLFGKALKEAPELREQMEIVTKCGIIVPGATYPGAWIEHYDASPESIEQSVDRSLRELQTEFIDVLLIHRPDWLTNAEETASGLRKVIDSGKVGSVGVSNYSVHQFALLHHFLGDAPATNQVEIHLLHMDAIYDGALDQCQALGVHPMAWSPLAGGRLFSSDAEDAVRTREALARLGAEYDATPDQMALAWVAALPCQPQLVIGTNQIERIRAAAESHKIKLDRQHWYALWAAAQGQNVP
ncbi:MAG: aldo/keto reductase [Candidatus Hydrogenedentes bacterium]|nr:aldo/keto reductase [Candidatus Hydrogenedentota bacterium]